MAMCKVLIVVVVVGKQIVEAAWKSTYWWEEN